MVNESKDEPEYLVGFRKGYSAGFQKGFIEGREEGMKTIFDEAYQRGYETGFDDGFEEDMRLVTFALEKMIEETMTDDAEILDKMRKVIKDSNRAEREEWFRDRIGTLLTEEEYYKKMKEKKGKT